MPQKAEKASEDPVNMRVLTFLLIITQSFILFNLVNGYQIEEDGSSNHWPPPKPLLSPPAAYHREQDDIRIKFPRHNDQKQMIRVGGIQIATNATTSATIERKFSASSVGHHQLKEGLFQSLSMFPLSSEEAKKKAQPRSFQELLDHHSSSLQLADVNAPPANSRAARKKESNSLIEQQQQTILLRNKRDLEGDGGFDDDEDEDEDDSSRLESPKVGQINGPELSSEYRVHHKGRKNTRPHFSVENHEGYAGSRFRSKTDQTCEMDCSHVVMTRRRTAGYRICGSDGQLYESLCELRVQSCRKNMRLFRKPKASCLQQNPPQDPRPATSTTTTTTMAEQQGHNGASEEIRIVELKRRCNLPAYNEMKSRLFDEFNGDVGSMFNYFDANGDNHIEAHELWPRQGDRSNKLLYAQLWDEHSSKCHSMHLRPQPSVLAGGHNLKDSTKCWFFLDFAFEPQFAPNPCSLSHLMLFDLKHPNNKFTPDTFKQAFEAPAASRAQTGELKPSQPETRRTRLKVMLGDSVSLGCLLNSTASQEILEKNLIENEGLDVDGIRCLWTRYNLNLGAIRDPHIRLEKRSLIGGKMADKRFSDLTLELKDSQLYLSGQYKCACYSKKIERTFEHLYSVQVLAKPRVNVRPQFQWSLPSSRVSFECHYDYIDTKDDKTGDDYDEPRGVKSDAACNQEQLLLKDRVLDPLDERGQFGLRVKWLKDNRELVVDSGKFNELNQMEQNLADDNNNNNGTTIVSSDETNVDDDDTFYSSADSSGGDATSPGDNNDDTFNYSRREQELKPKAIHKQPYSSRRASITMAASRLTLENLTLGDSGQHTCRVDVPSDYGDQNFKLGENIAKRELFEIVGQSEGTLLVQEQPKSDQNGEDEIYRSYLWMFHDNGISIYKLQNDDGQEMELLREINGHSLVSGEVDGNWNQLTLCGGLNPEQVVICEWSDNALHIDVKHGSNSKTRKYIYVGQPNLNRIIVMDGLRFEIVAIINTEPQPRKLYLNKPTKIHLSKWVRRRLSPAANARWLAAIGTHAHSLKSTPETKLYSVPTAYKTLSRQQRHSAMDNGQQAGSVGASKPKPSPLIQHDIWLLCYGQPLVVDPAGDEHLEEAGRFYSTFSGNEQFSDPGNASSNDHKFSQKSSINPPQVQPFTPRLAAGGAPFGLWPVWPNKESKLRNRKSVHIIQSTFFPRSALRSDSLHNHAIEDEFSAGEDESDCGSSTQRNGKNDTVVGEFKESTVLTTHHVYSGISHLAKPQMYLARPQFDLIQDLYVPPKPYSMESNDRHKSHYAYVTHYDDQRLFRVSMDEYRYDREIDLQNCDPINLVNTAQGLLVIQCRAPITHNLIGQMVLDQLTSSKIELNANIRAQESYLSPDHRYLVSIFNNSTLASATTRSVLMNHISDSNRDNQRNRSIDSTETKRQSIIYVQLVTMSGLRLQYEIKTALEIIQCSFVWKDGYYAAIFVSTNRRDNQSEILSLRLADSRLQLMARVPGLISVARHKDQLIVSPELRLAALSTNQGSYVIDLEDNRVSQSLRHHQSPPTLLWV